MAPLIPSIDPSDEIKRHGMSTEPTHMNIQCGYCGKLVSGFDKLQLHLGGLRGIVKCTSVEEDVKEYFRAAHLAEKVGNLEKLAPCLKRRCISNENRGSRPFAPNAKLLAQMASSSNGRPNNLRACSWKEGLNSVPIPRKRLVGRFFYLNGVDLSAVASPSFKDMMGIFSDKDDAIDSIPSIDELQGWILEDELNEIEKYVKDIRLSWCKTGCSIMLDGWTDRFGRNLMSVFVDCPEGPTYLRSADVSPPKGADEFQVLKLFLESVMEEVGIENVVQIVAHTWSESLKAFGREFVEKYRSPFWTFSGNHCLSLILDKIAGINPIKLTLQKAKRITRFFYSRSEALNLLRKHIGGKNLVTPSNIKSATPFLTLDNFLTERSNMERMITSPRWLASKLGDIDEGKEVAQMIQDSSFWDEVLIAVKASIPIVKAVSLLNKGSEPNLGFIYETMDQIKETIREEFGGEESMYTQYWVLIDEIWNPILYNDIHAAGYFLNPRLFFTDDFYCDTEVATGLLYPCVQMLDGFPALKKALDQVPIYENGQGGFELGIDYKDSISPAAWWEHYGADYPELQKIAVRTLSQTCNGVESYGLRRDIAEKLLSDTGRNAIEQQKLLSLTYLHYNMKLKQSKLEPGFDILADQIDPTDDWITGGYVELDEGEPSSAPERMEIEGAV